MGLQAEPPRPERQQGHVGLRFPPHHTLVLMASPLVFIPGARITVWYEEEHDDGRTVDVPYVGVASSFDASEGGLIVSFALEHIGHPQATTFVHL